MLYFIPNAKVLRPGLLVDHGIDDLLSRPANRESMEGPSGGSGLIVANAGTPTDSMRFDKSWTWSKRFGSDVWMGFDPKNPPGAKELARDQQLPGHSVTLLDGQKYIVPLLRSFDGDQLEGPIRYNCLLDQTLTQDPETGKMITGDVVPKYRELWDDAIAIADNLLAQLMDSDAVVTASLPEDIVDNFVANLLAVNYHVGNPELSALSLLTIDLSRQVLHAAIDWETLRANLGKRIRRSASSGTSIESGETQPIGV